MQFDEGALETERWLAYTGTKLETADTAKATPVRHRASALLYSTTYWIFGSSVGYRGVVGARLTCSDLPTIVRHEGAKEDGVLRAAVLHK